VDLVNAAAQSQDQPFLQQPPFILGVNANAAVGGIRQGRLADGTEGALFDRAIRIEDVNPSFLGAIPFIGLLPSVDAGDEQVVSAREEITLHLQAVQIMSGAGKYTQGIDLACRLRTAGGDRINDVRDILHIAPNFLIVKLDGELLEMARDSAGDIFAAQKFTLFKGIAHCGAARKDRIASRHAYIFGIKALIVELELMVLERPQG